jgi:nickel transport protein
MPTLARLLLLVWTLGTFTGSAAAHGTGARVLDDANAVAVHFHYADQGPMQYAEILVFSPSDKEVEHQNGRTDRNGVFAFRPDAPGTWIIEADDGMGHKERARIRIEQPDPDDPQTLHVKPKEASRTIGVVAGLSLLLNLSLAAYIVKNRSRPSGDRG